MLISGDIVRYAHLQCVVNRPKNSNRVPAKGEIIDRHMFLFSPGNKLLLMDGKYLHHCDALRKCDCRHFVQR